MKEDSPEFFKHSTISQYYRMLFEYHLLLMFACVWNRKEKEVSIETRFKIIDAMRKPILGTTLDIIMELNEVGTPVFDLNKNYEKIVREFIHKRNTSFGHKIVIPHLQEVAYHEIWQELEKYYQKLAKFEEKFWGEKPEFLMRKATSQNQFITFLPGYRPKTRTVEKIFAENYRHDELYFSCAAQNFKVSPFIVVNQSNNVKFDFYYFTEYRLQSGKFNYYLVSELRNDFEWSKTYVDYFTAYRKERKYTICRANGVISNKFESNYDYFVNIPPFSAYVTQIWEFLIKNQSTVCLTIRGGGGTGKTALVHYICMKYILEPMTSTREFNYVIFCSAKDREFKLDPMTERGKIYEIDSQQIITSYEDILQTVSRVLELNLNPDSAENIEKIENSLIEENGILLIVDDFETLSDTEKNKVVELIKKMKIGRHKVLITTRSQYLIGAAYNVERMSIEQVISFMKKRFENIPDSEKIQQKFKALLEKNTASQIYEITMGLPSHAIMLASLLTFKDFSETVLNKETNDASEDFLLGRLYDYFSTQTSKLLFLIIAFFVKYDLKTIPLDQLQIFYKLYCTRYEKPNVDFKNDLSDLRKWIIINIEDDYVQIETHISHKVFDKCLNSFLTEYDSPNIFDEKFFKIIVEKGMIDGILIYAGLEDSYLDENILKLFAFENAAKYLNSDRFKLIEIFIEKNPVSENEDTIRELYEEGKKYFELGAEYDSIFIRHGLKLEKSNLIDKTNLNPHKQSVISFAGIFKQLEEFLEETDYALVMKSRTAREKAFSELKAKIGKICKTDLNDALNNFSAENLNDAKKVKEMLDEISRTNKNLSCIGNENYQRLESFLAKN